MFNIGIVDASFDNDVSGPYVSLALKRSLESSKPHYYLNSGWLNIKEDKTIDDIYNAVPKTIPLVRCGFRMGKIEKIFGNADGEMVSVSRDSASLTAVRAIFNSELECSNFDTALQGVLEKTGATAGSVSIIGRGPQGLGLFELGVSKTVFEASNYPYLMEDYNHIVSCLSSSDPCGRLILVEGAPGTGKSYLIRALVAQLDCIAVFVPSTLVSALSGPELAPLLLSHREDSVKPIILILEDADSALIDRKSGNLDSLSTLLNLGDGLFGQLADIRIIATTNAERSQFDAAILRPGRLCRHLATKPLSRTEAKAVYDRLVPDNKVEIWTPSTLADVYRRARQDGWGPPKSKSEYSPQYI
jgi:hypothetical protein